MVPSRDEATAQLERVLASDVFAAATRLSRFLRFVSERSLAGESERLKEYVIGVEVFERGAQYDPRLDSIVRVEAGRLRTKLDQYYNGPGREDGIVIRLQKGSYAPSFEWRAKEQLPPLPQNGGNGSLSSIHRAPDTLSLQQSEQASAGSAPESNPTADARTSRRKLHLAVAAVVLLGVAAAVIVMRLWPSAPPPDAVAVLPFEPSTASAEDKLLAVRLTEGVTAELVRTGRFSVVPSRDARINGSEGSAQSIARRLQASWLLEARVMSGGADTVLVEARLMNPARNRKLWVDSFGGESDELGALARKVGAAAATALEQHQAAERNPTRAP